MKCKKCNKSNPEGSKFCAFCGNSLDNKKSFEQQELMDKVIEHLEFIGYEVGSPQDIDDGKSMRVVARNKNRSNLTLTFYDNGMITLFSYYTVNTEKIKKTFDKALEDINKMNLSSLICSFCIPDNKDSIICSSIYSGEYSKKSFSHFLDYYEADIKNGFNSSGIMDFA